MPRVKFCSIEPDMMANNIRKISPSSDLILLHPCPNLPRHKLPNIKRQKYRERLRAFFTKTPFDAPWQMTELPSTRFPCQPKSSAGGEIISTKEHRIIPMPENIKHDKRQKPRHIKAYPRRKPQSLPRIRFAKKIIPSPSVAAYAKKKID